MITIKVDAAEMLESLDELQLRQGPFAIARGLTMTAADAQKVTRARMPSAFTLRNNWTQQGVKITPAKKDNLRAEVFDRDPWMVLQESGGEKIHIGSRQYFAVPTSFLYQLIGGQNRIIPPYMRPKAVLGITGGLFVGRKGIRRAPRKVAGMEGFIQEIHGKQFICVTMRAGDRDIIPLYLLSPSAHVSPRLELEETVRKTVSDRFESNFDQALKEACANMRLRLKV